MTKANVLFDVQTKDPMEKKFIIWYTYLLWVKNVNEQKKTIIITGQKDLYYYYYYIW